MRTREKKIINNECAILFNKTCINESLLPKYIYIYTYVYGTCIYMSFLCIQNLIYNLFMFLLTYVLKLHHD